MKTLPKVKETLSVRLLVSFIALMPFSRERKVGEIFSQVL